jgi:hypothetical protein
MAYYQDEYDKWFIKVVNYLMANKKKYKEFSTQKELGKLFSLGGDGSMISSIKIGSRGVPKEQRDEIDKILHTKFKIQRAIPSTYELKEPGSFEVQEPAAVYKLDKSGYNSLSGEVAMLKEYNGYLKAMLEQYLKDIKANSDIVLANQQITLAHISADSTLAAVRYVGDDPERLGAELRKRDKLIGVALEKA